MQAAVSGQYFLENVDVQTLCKCVYAVDTRITGCDVLVYADIDECEFDNGGCSQLCHNTEGSFICRCQAGFQLGTDAVSCFSDYSFISLFLLY